ncbi:hypothetical protein ACROYT_G031553 [Oculina patagonica]
MIRSGNGLPPWQVVLIFVCLVHDADCIGYELDDDLKNWTSAALEYADDSFPLARISSIKELCEAQVEIRTDNEYWTALRLDNTGTLQWGHLPNNTANISTKLLDKTQPANRCYAINRSAMKLLSKECDSLHGVIISNDDNSSSELFTYYSDGCIEYELSKCSQLDDDQSLGQDLPHEWSCKQSNGMMFGSCQVEDAILTCCQKYCQKENLTYTIDLASGLITKVMKVPRGFPGDVEILVKYESNIESNDDKVIINSQVFNDTERVVAVVLYPMTDDQDLNSTQRNISNFTLNSDVIGVVLKPPHRKMIQNKIIIYFSHKKPKEHQIVLQRKCVFWKEDIRTSNGTWSSDGCMVLNDSSLERTVCSCNHLTNFAVLMQFKDVETSSNGGQIPPEHKVALLIITYIGCALSLIGEVLSVFVYVVFMKFKVEGIQIRVNFATALFFAQVVFLAGIDATNNTSVCVLVAVLLHYFYLASFGWMLLEGVFLYIMIVEVFSTVNMRYLYLFAWGYPVIPVVISLAVGSSDDKGLRNYTNENFCWLSFHKNLSWAFIVPVLLITVINFAILMAVLREIRNLQEPNPSKMKTFKKSLKSFVILTPLLGLTWVFGLLAVTDAGLVFQYIFTILNSTQGMIIFLLHVLRNSEVRTAFHHKLLKWRFDRFYSSSAARAQGDASQSRGKRKRQIDPDESKGNELHITRQSGEQPAFTVRVSTPSND